ncbi:hypothetical protein [Methanoculleus sp. UBA430]|uniref:hypothetical protein n=1 Tax=Methanoculleus sp. UBA430 TaxID=1915511 RepID=UPI0025FB0626|nr:hypothetical protein [Methanoculleus sp. UBA430]
MTRRADHPLPWFARKWACPADVAHHDQIVALVEKMLDLNKRLVAAKVSHEKEVLAGMIDATDRQIDRLVYELYGLTEEEIAVVEKIGQ